ncbi:MAG: hypothetical protein AAF384_16445 [Pseudomonadota bacterium]
MANKNYLIRGVVLAMMWLTLTGCSQFGPSVIAGSRTDYNLAMRETESEQMLLNLVRLRYRDPSYFLEAAALNTQFSIAPSAEISSTFDFDGATSNGVRGRFAFEEKPTVTYTPLQGEKFVRQVMSRVALETILLLDAGGWNIDRVLRLTVEKLNGLDNAPRASGPTPTDAPQYASFLRAVGLIAELERGENVSILYRVNESSGSYVLRLNPLAQSAQLQELRELLGLSAEQNEYRITVNEATHRPDTINLQTRSFMGVLYFLSQGVSVPGSDLSSGRVTQTLDDSGNAFDWSQVTAGLLAVQSSAQAPKNPAVALDYRGHWFYIDDSDLDSKSTFSLLGLLYALQSKGNQSAAPVLTLPVGG